METACSSLHYTGNFQVYQMRFYIPTYPVLKPTPVTFEGLPMLLSYSLLLLSVSFLGPFLELVLSNVRDTSPA